MTEVFMDGTFSLAPPLFEQVFVILSRREHYVFPVLYAVLPNKQQRTYNALFTLIKKVWPQFNTTSISLDFEKAVISATSEVFPDADLRGCLFHLMKNFRKHLTDCGLLLRYNKETTFSLQAWMIVFLAFVPVAGLD